MTRNDKLALTSVGLALLAIPLAIAYLMLAGGISPLRPAPVLETLKTSKPYDGMTKPTAQTLNDWGNAAPFTRSIHRGEHVVRSMITTNGRWGYLATRNMSLDRPRRYVFKRTPSGWKMVGSGTTPEARTYRCDSRPPPSVTTILKRDGFRCARGT